MNRLLIATHNPAKKAELKSGLIGLEKAGIELVTLTDVGVGEEPEETGATFKDNSLLKARFYSQLTGLPAIADDGGLVIPYLNNEPGVKSSRWLGRKASDEELINHTLKRLSGAPDKSRNAYLELSLCFHDPKNGKTLYECETISGHIAYKPYVAWRRGFPYRALFIVDKFKKYYDLLDPEEHEAVNHRVIALKRLTKKIIDLIV